MNNKRISTNELVKNMTDMHESTTVPVNTFSHDNLSTSKYKQNTLNSSVTGNTNTMMSNNADIQK